MESQAEAVKSLPFEDTLWIITAVTDVDSESGGDSRMVVVMDSKCRMLATSHADVDEMPFSVQAHRLLCGCAMKPMIGQPRKPRFLKVKTNCLVDTLNVDDLGIQCISGQLPCPCCTPAPPLRTCCSCQFRGSPALFIKCPHCDTVNYCSSKCLSEDASVDRGHHCHSIWCSKMASYASEDEQLADLPFSFISETTNPAFDKWKLHDFLKQNGVFGLGFWRREGWSICQKDAPEYGDLADEVDPFVLILEGIILEDETPAADLSFPIENWKAYYEWRGLSLSSPVCILLQFPLTLYHIIQNRLHLDYPSSPLHADAKLIIHVVGVEKEADMTPIFKEVGILLPHLQFDIHFFGPHISKKVHKKNLCYRNVEITLHRKLYHRFSGEKPHLVIGYNAGLSAYMSWKETLIKLRKDRTPAYFTDYCRYSCECAKTPMQELTLGTASTAVINPFRSPVRMNSEEHDMPGYSNAFLFHLQYSD